MSNHPSLPLIMGTEQELAISINGEAEAPELGEYLTGYHANGGGFMTNGYRAYQDSAHYEIATPECSTPKQLMNYILASQELAFNGLRLYAQEQSTEYGEISAALHNRVSDMVGNTWACHDNFHVTSRQYGLLSEDSGEGSAVIRGFLASRSFVTGAGLVSHEGLRFSQKNNGINEVNSYGYINSHYRLSEASEQRFEIRSSDINISPWQINMRLGSAALLLAITDLPVRACLLQVDKDTTTALTQEMNEAYIEPDGTLKAPSVVRRAVDNQRSLACAALELELTRPYRAIAMELKSYCDDMDAVMAGRATISLLADRVDWAAKFETILRRYHTNTASGKPRTLNDYTGAAQDLSYDRLSITAANGIITDSTIGWGYVLRNRGKFKRSISPHAIQIAQKHPPQNTRAFMRAKLLKEYDDIKCDWSSVEITDQGDGYELILPPRATSHAQLVSK